MITYLTPQENEIMLASYLPHKVQVQWQKAQYNEQVKGLELLPITGQLLEISYAGPRPRAILHAGQYEYPLLSELRPVLYDLADLPKLPRRATDDATPLVVVLRKLSFTSSLDLGTGEGVIAAEVLRNSLDVAGRTVLLHLRVHTDYIDPNNHDTNEGAEYEVSLSAFGEVMWRNVTADKLSIDEAGRTGRGHWQHVHGTHLMRAWEYLHELHVAVGAVAETERHYIEATSQYKTRYRYVRKQLPQQEGEPS